MPSNSLPEPVPAPEGFKLFESEEFGQVRVVTEQDGEPRFVAKDVAEVLGYKKPENAVKAHCKAPESCPLKSGGQVRTMTIIPERDVYRLVMRSHLPEAERFEEWFVAKDVGEVLGYTNPQKAVRDHCKCPKTLKQNDSFSLTNSPRGITVIPESDVYRLIIWSKLPPGGRDSGLGYGPKFIIEF